MDEYVKREKIRESYEKLIRSYMHGEPYIADWRFDEMIKSLPAADVIPVRHGKWIEPQRLYYGAKQYECSLCYSDTFWKKHSITEKYPHCPNCGCRMDGGDDE